MFQSFDVTASPDQGPPRLSALRVTMAEHGAEVFVVPRADAHQGEYVAARDERLSWLTGFTGSAGFAVITSDRAGVFVDGRYRVQVREQVADVFEPVDWPEMSLLGWLSDVAPNAKIAFDPWLHTPKEVRGWQKAGRDVVPVENLIDLVWDNQPAAPAGKAHAQPEDLAGRTASEKIETLASTLKDAGCCATVLTLPDSISWLLNIRGSDVAHTPIVQAFAIVTDAGKTILFVDPAKLTEVTLAPEVTVATPESFLVACGGLDGKVWIDPATVPQAVFHVISQPHEARDLCALPKASKTDAEIAGARAAHARDAVAVVRFLNWLEGAVERGTTEIDAAVQLEMFRRETNVLRDISFETISAAGAHAALPHYRVNTQSNALLRAGEVYLVDSGGQYQDGTTDITRTVGLGEQAFSVRQAFTRVLQGMIAISELRFPKGISGADIDAVARVPLWRAGQDYAHGTGHGVGSYLSVHEGPQRLARTGHVPLEPGMILSNEPGFYVEGAFGIRIENLIVVRPAPDQPDQSIETLYEFETLNYVPIDREMIVMDMLRPDERDWINAYHQECLHRLAGQVDAEVAAWLHKVCAPI
ncbi:MAG: aminopeptidase P family protein [Marinovum sp.]|nr:aminopeptidase P family protein [Marinovum sp.]